VYDKEDAPVGSDLSVHGQPFAYQTTTLIQVYSEAVVEQLRPPLMNPSVCEAIVIAPQEDYSDGSWIEKKE
jgi:hypothetical protein